MIKDVKEFRNRVMRKTTAAILLCFALIGLVLAIGCEKPKPQPTDNNGNGIIFPEDKDTNISLQGTKWKLAGIVDSQVDTLIKLEPKDCEECYTLVFDTEYTAKVRFIKAILKLVVRS